MAERRHRWFVAAQRALLGATLAATGCQFTISVGPCGGGLCQKGAQCGGGVAPMNARPQWTAPPGGDLPPANWMPPAPNGAPPATTGMRSFPPAGSVRGPDLPPPRGPFPEAGMGDGG
jgi:hypothetical protein